MKPDWNQTGTDSLDFPFSCNQTVSVMMVSVVQNHRDHHQTVTL